jgi:TRAP transporter TAXI family solute receptor
MATALSQMINNFTSTISAVSPVNSPALFHDLLKIGEAHLMIEQATECWHAYQGDYGASWIYPKPQGAYKGHRLLMQLNNQYWDFVTAGFTGVTTIPQLKDKKIAMKFPTTPNGYFARIQLQAYGVDPDKDVKAIEYPSSRPGLQDLQDKKIDAVHCTMGGAKIVELDAMVGAVWLPYDPAKIDAIQKTEPMVRSGVAQTYIPGVKTPTPVMYIPNLLVAAYTVPDDVAYNVVKAVVEHAKDSTGVSWEIKEWTKERALFPETVMPYHPGAIKYFKEQGMWTDALENLQKKLIADQPKY